MSSGPLHITNGDIAADGIRRLTSEEVIAWRDVLHDGPVPSVDDASLRRVRAEFLAGQEWAAVDEALRELAERDAAVEAAAGARPIVLWFEPDLYDQLQLLQVLDLLGRAGAPADSITLVQPASHLGPLTTEMLAQARSSGAPATSAAHEAASGAWNAFRAPDPLEWEQVARVAHPELPFLAGAVRRHLEEYPSAEHGLARSEAQILGTIAHQPIPLEHSFRECTALEEWSYLGDLSFLELVRGLAAQPHPLLRGSALLQPALARGGVMNRALWRETIAITADGRAVLGGEAHRLTLRGIDRWLGGVHLRSGRIWHRTAAGLARRDLS